MKKKKVVLALLALCLISGIFFAAQFVSAVFSNPCNISTSLINQDPYPAIPGDYVKLIFQVNGMENPDCGEVSIKLNEAFPFYLDPGATTTFTANSGIFNRDYSSFLIAPYKVRVSEEALDGVSPIEVMITYPGGSTQTTTLEEFDVEIEDKRADFEIYVKNYDTLTNMLTLEVLNVGKADIQSLTLKIPDQENISIKGSNTNIMGDLDSNDYTTADFEATSSGGKVNIGITYTDEINVRRTLTKVITFEPSYFQNRKADQKDNSYWYLAITAALVVVLFLLYRKYKKGKKHHVSE